MGKEVTGKVTQIMIEESKELTSVGKGIWFSWLIEL